MKIFGTIVLSLAIIFTMSSPVLSAEKISSNTTTKGKVPVVELRLLLNAFSALAEDNIEGILRSLKLLSNTSEVMSGEWDAMKGLLGEFSKSDIHAAAVWFVRPDGSYYTVEQGLTNKNLRDRSYFPGLMSGNDVKGDLVISKSTGKRAAIIAVPVKKEGKMIGALGVSLSVEGMSGMLEKKMDLPEQIFFYALDAEGQTSLHKISSLLFAFPSDMGSKSLKNAVKEMLSKNEGTVHYEFFGEKTVVFKRSPLTGWVFAMGYVQGAPSKSQLPPIISDLKKEITTQLNRMDSALSVAAKELSHTGLKGAEARKILDKLCQKVPSAADCSAVDHNGRMVTVEPEAYRQVEGFDISKQEQVVRLKKSKKPVMSKVFRAVEGFDAIDIEYPVFSPQGELIGAVSLLLRPESLFASAVVPLIQGLPVDVWAMQKDGRILYDPDTEEIGLMLFSAPVYKPFPQLLSLGKRIAKEKSGSGTYEFLGKGLTKPVRKEAYWTTVSILGTDWRLVVTHLVNKENVAGRKDLASLGVKSSEEALRDLADNAELADALSKRQGEVVQGIFKRYYESHYGLYSVQWVDSGGINLYAYPEENSVLNFDFHSGQVPSSKDILEALSLKKEISFDAPLAEGKEGSFFMAPVHKDKVFLGMVYIIRIKP